MPPNTPNDLFSSISPSLDCNLFSLSKPTRHVEAGNLEPLQCDAENKINVSYDEIHVGVDRHLVPSVRDFGPDVMISINGGSNNGTFIAFLLQQRIGRTVPILPVTVSAHLDFVTGDNEFRFDQWFDESSTDGLRANGKILIVIDSEKDSGIVDFVKREVQTRCMPSCISIAMLHKSTGFESDIELFHAYIASSEDHVCYPWEFRSETFVEDSQEQVKPENNECDCCLEETPQDKNLGPSPSNSKASIPHEEEKIQVKVNGINTYIGETPQDDNVNSINENYWDETPQVDDDGSVHENYWDEKPVNEEPCCNNYWDERPVSEESDGNNYWDEKPQGKVEERNYSNHCDDTPQVTLSDNMPVSDSDEMRVSLQNHYRSIVCDNEVTVTNTDDDREALKLYYLGMLGSNQSSKESVSQTKTESKLIDPFANVSFWNPKEQEELTMARDLNEVSTCTNCCEESTADTDQQCYWDECVHEKDCDVDSTTANSGYWNM